MIIVRIFLSFLSYFSSGYGTCQLLQESACFVIVQKSLLA